MRSYTSFDLLRFARLKQENPDIKPLELITLYNEKYPELSAKEKLINISKALNINSLHKALTNSDIDKNDPFYKAWNEFQE